ncbi:hypothetical protein PCE1_002282 [Barthelona sp. PCE]
MPRTVHTLSNNFIFTPFSGKIIVSSTEGYLNTRKLCIIDKRTDLSVQGPSVDPKLSNRFEMLKPTLLRPCIFYRTRSIERNVAPACTVYTLIELYLFEEGDFKFIADYEVPFSFNGCLLDERWLLTGKYTFQSTEITLITYDLKENIVVASETFILGWFHKYFVHEGVAYLISGKNSRIVKMVSWANGKPSLVDPVHKDLNIVALDMTPGDSRFIIEHSDKAATFSLNEDGELSSIPLDFLLPDLKGEEEIARILDVVVPRLSYRGQFLNVYCEHWDFVTLGNDVFCTVYDARSGETTFCPLFRRDFDCIFVLGNVPMRLSYDRRSRTLMEYPLLFDLVGNSIKLLIPSSEGFKGDVLRNGKRFYDLDVQEWRVGYVTQNDREVRIYIGDSEQSFILRKGIKNYDVLFNNRHYVAIFERRGQKTISINGEIAQVQATRCPKVVGNRIWYIKDRNILTMLELEAITGELIDSKELSFEGQWWCLYTNPYCAEECVMAGSTTFIVRYSANEGILRCFEISSIKYSVCFVDQGYLSYGGKVYKFGCDSITDMFDLDMYSDYTYSPERGIGFNYTQLDGNKVKIHTFKIKDDGTGVIVFTQILDLVEFLSQCEISSLFSSFDQFRK